MIYMKDTNNEQETKKKKLNFELKTHIMHKRYSINVDNNMPNIFRRF